MKTAIQYIIIFIVSISISMFFILLDRDASAIKADAATYVAIAHNLAQGNGFSYMKHAPYEPTMVREPVYPLFLAAIFRIFRENIFLVQIIQALITALTSLVVFAMISCIYNGRKAPFVIGLLIASFPALNNYAAYMLTECLFTFLLALSAFFLVKSFSFWRMKYFFYAGLIMGLAALCRVILSLFCFFILIFMCIGYYQKYGKFSLAGFTRAAGLLLLGFFMVVAPWIIRNHILFGKNMITTRGYSTLYVRALKSDLTAQEMKMYALYSFSEYLADKYYPGNKLSSTADGYFYRPVQQKNIENERSKITPEQAEDHFRDEASRMIRAHPVKFVLTGFFELIKLNSFGQIPLLNGEFVQAWRGNPVLPPLFRGALKALGFIIFILAIVGMITKYKVRDYLPIIAIIIYFNAVHFFLDATGRYAVPIIPYYLLFSVLGIKFIMEKRPLWKR